MQKCKSVTGIYINKFPIPLIYSGDKKLDVAVNYYRKGVLTDISYKHACLLQHELWGPSKLNKSGQLLIPVFALFDI